MTIDDVVIRLEGVSKRFKLYSGVRNRLLDWLNVPARGRHHEEFWALRDISCEVQRGECVGIIGPNGAGKSTLLKLLTGSLYATCGRMEVRGRVLSLLELGTGFTPDLTGRQNIEQSARLLGLPPGYASARVLDIQHFAELGDYFDRPVKFYSSGMLVRLAFSLFSTMQPEVFLVDEALAVGDLRFANKAFGRIRAMLDAGTTLLFVSHDLQLINQLCTRTLWLQSGTIQMDGMPSAVTRAYQQFVVHGTAELPFVVEQPESDREEWQPATNQTPAVPIAAPREVHPDLALGSGWYPLEAYSGEIFRWAAGEAEVVVPNLGPDGHALVLDLEPALPPGVQVLAVEITDGTARTLAKLELSGRATVHVPIPSTDTLHHRMFLRALAGLPGQDGRVLSFRVFRWGWSDESNLHPIAQARDWIDATSELELDREIVSMRRALRRSAPVAHAAARITDVVTRAGGGGAAVRFGSHDVLGLEVTIEGLDHVQRPVVGVQVRDQFDRMVWTTRTDWQGQPLPNLEAGQRVLVAFSTGKLLLGKGLYQITVAVHPWPREDQIFHWIDGVWRFEVVDSPAADFKGAFDLGWQCAVRALLEASDTSTLPVPEP